MIQSELKSRLEAKALRVETLLESLLASQKCGVEVARPDLLVSVMRHASLGGGKRLRPFLTLEAAEMFGISGDGPLRAGCALEIVHCYSLVHDDLPAMDDDDLRRGKPTVHKLYDDAMGVLAGDALLTLAFDVLADKRTSSSAARQVRLVRELAQASGLGGMVGGQMLDLAAEGRYPAVTLPSGEAGVVLIQSMKTGALMRAACRMGGVLGGASAGDMRAIDRYATALGLAFQIRDDLLDVESDAATLGKAAGKDAQAGKATFISLLGIEGAKARLDEATRQGEAALVVFGAAAQWLRALLVFNRERKS